MDEPVIGLVVKPLTQPQRAFEVAHEKAPADRPGGVSVEQARGEQRVRVEHRDAEGALNLPRARHGGAVQRDERPRRERLRRRIHRHLVGEDPRMAALGPATHAGGEAHHRPVRRIVGFARDFGRQRRDGGDVGHDPMLPGWCRR